MQQEILQEQPIDLGGLVFLMDDHLARSGRPPIDIWEGQLKTVLIELPSDLRPAAEKYVDTIIGLTRAGLLKPDEYAAKINEENHGEPVWFWRFSSEATARVHDKMVEEVNNGHDEKRQKAATNLTEAFMKVIHSTGIRHEMAMGKAMGYIVDKFSKFPHEPQQGDTVET